MVDRKFCHRERIGLFCEPVRVGWRRSRRKVRAVMSKSQTTSIPICHICGQPLGRDGMRTCKCRAFEIEIDRRKTVEIANAAMDEIRKGNFQPAIPVGRIDLPDPEVTRLLGLDWINAANKVNRLRQQLAKAEDEYERAFQRYTGANLKDATNG